MTNMKRRWNVRDTPVREQSDGWNEKGFLTAMHNFRGKSRVLPVEKTLTWKLRILVSISPPWEAGDTKQGAACLGIGALEPHRHAGWCGACPLAAGQTINDGGTLIFSLLLQGTPDFFFYAQLRTAVLLISREQSHDRNVFVSLFQLSHCLQLSPFELLGFPDKQVAQIKTNSWHLSSWDEKSSALLVGFRFLKSERDLIPLCNDKFHFEFHPPSNRKSLYKL